MDTFDELAQKWFSSSASGPDADIPQSPFRRVIMFVDNAGQPSSPASSESSLAAVLCSGGKVPSSFWVLHFCCMAQMMLLWYQSSMLISSAEAALSGRVPRHVKMGPEHAGRGSHTRTAPQHLLQAHMWRCACPQQPATKKVQCQAMQNRRGQSCMAPVQARTWCWA